MKEVHFDRAALTYQPSPIQLSPNATLAVVTKSAQTFQLVDLVTNTKYNIGTALTNELANLVLYDEDISITTSIPDTEVVQLRWLGEDLCVLTNNLNLIVLNRTTISPTSYEIKFNVIEQLIQHYQVSKAKLLKFQDLLKLRIHSFAICQLDIYSEKMYPPLVAIGSESGEVTILEIGDQGLKVVVDNIYIGSKTVVALAWSSWSTDDISYIAITLNDNSVYVQKIKYASSGIELLELTQLQKPQKLKVTIMKWYRDELLSIVSTNNLQIYQPSGDMANIELGTVYAITDICYIRDDANLQILLINGWNYLGVFMVYGTKFIKQYKVDYNSSKSITSFNPPASLVNLKKTLSNLNAKHGDISVRGITLDPLGKSIFIGFLNNNPQMEYRRIKLMNFRLQQVTVTNSMILQDEMMKINFGKISGKYIVNLIKNSNIVVPWLDILNEWKFQTVETADTLSHMLDLNLTKNSQLISLLQVAHQVNFHLGLNEVLKDVESQILKFISQIVIQYIELNGVKLSNKYDKAVYLSYKSLHQELITGGSEPIEFSFNNGVFHERFQFYENEFDWQSIVSVNEIPFKRCSLTLLPLLNLNNLQCDSCKEMSLVNLSILQTDQQEIGELTTDILTKFGKRCIYSGDQLYKNY